MRLLINVIIFGKTGADPFSGEARIEGKRIQKVVSGTNRIFRQNGLDVIDGYSDCLMPGLAREGRFADLL